MVTYKVKSICQIGFACPSQWEGKLDDDSDLYIRYRWGFLRIDVNGKQVFGTPHGNDYDGIISLDTVNELTGDLFDFSQVQYYEREY